nr:hypothetical protein HmN_000192500 [Hymenolepis microstoma]
MFELQEENISDHRKGIKTGLVEVKKEGLICQSVKASHILRNDLIERFVESCRAASAATNYSTKRRHQQFVDGGEEEGNGGRMKEER